MRDTLYQDVHPERYRLSFCELELSEVNNQKAGKYQSSKRLEVVELQPVRLAQNTVALSRVVHQSVTPVAACN